MFDSNVNDYIDEITCASDNHFSNSLLGENSCSPYLNRLSDSLIDVLLFSSNDLIFDKDISNVRLTNIVSEFIDAYLLWLNAECECTEHSHDALVADVPLLEDYSLIGSPLIPFSPYTNTIIVCPICKDNQSLMSLESMLSRLESSLKSFQEVSKF